MKSLTWEIWGWAGALLMNILGCQGGYAQTGTGGGIFADDRAFIIGTLIYGNQAEEGFGVGGGDVHLLNCTVGENKAMVGREATAKPGDIYCADGVIRSTADYLSENRDDAIGVVFWVNTDVYAFPHGYVVGLEEGTGMWGQESLLQGGIEVPVQDTVCYVMNEAMCAAGAEYEAALYCRNYRAAGQVGEIRWLLPAGYQLSFLYTNRLKVEQTFDFLKGTGSNIVEFADDWYWSASEAITSGGKYGWMMQFGTGGFLQYQTDECLKSRVHRVRPMFMY